MIVSMREIHEFKGLRFYKIQSYIVLKSNSRRENSFTIKIQWKHSYLSSIFSFCFRYANFIRLTAVSFVSYI